MKPMTTRQEIESIIRKHIESKEKLGHHGSTSGHMSHTGYSLDEYSFEEIEDAKIRVKYSYTTVVETEFTYYPDNPPYEYYHEMEMLLDKDMNILSDKVLETNTNFDIDLPTDEDMLFEVKYYLEQVLANIEWKYGDNRAPFKYPPELKVIDDEKGVSSYVCIIETDFGDDDEKISYTAGSPEALLAKVKKDIPRRFNLNFEIE
jgi:hypothetical protein